MAVRVINSEPDPNVVKHVVCPHCGVKLEYVPKDVRRVIDSDGDCVSVTIKCANKKCGQRVDVPEPGN